MYRVTLLHWDPDRADDFLARIRAAGCEPVTEPPPGPEFMRALRADPPAAIVIGLDRRPSVGRDMAAALRAQKATRGIPILFAGGEPAKVAPIRALLPDAAFTSWEELPAVLREAIANPPVEPANPGSAMAAYAGRPLPAKLGIKPGSRVALVDASDGFAQTLGELPAGTRLQTDADAPSELVLWFARSPEGVADCLAWAAGRPDLCPLWIAWPKKGRGAGLTQQRVREAGLSAGLVDYKICSIDDEWSGLLFARRREAGVA